MTNDEKHKMKAAALEAVLQYAPHMRGHARRLRIDEPSTGSDGLYRVHVDSRNRTWRVIFRPEGTEVVDW